MRASTRLAALAVLAAAVASSGLHQAQSAASIQGLVGRWSGWGSISMESGAAEQVKCVATYVTPGAGSRPTGSALTQNLRCASKSFRIDATADLDINGEEVRGRWQERTYAAEGSVSGRLTGTGFNLSIQGENFTAAMVVSVNACKQSITIAPRGFEIQRIAIGLDKC